MAVDYKALSSRTVAPSKGKGTTRYDTWSVGEGDKVESVSCQMTAEIVGFLMAHNGGADVALSAVKRILKAKGYDTASHDPEAKGVPIDGSLRMRISKGRASARSPFKPPTGCKIRLVMDDKGNPAPADSYIGRVIEHVNPLLFKQEK
jgi:hypothetical protein